MPFPTNLQMQIGVGPRRLRLPREWLVVAAERLYEMGGADVQPDAMDDAPIDEEKDCDGKAQNARDRFRS